MAGMWPLCVCVAYDGCDYHGWQEQPDVPTVAGTMQRAFYDAFGHDIKVVGASRTDAGVHALGQVARFYTNRDLSCEKMRWVWNNQLPPSIHIRRLWRPESGFHPQHNIRHKTYYYHIALRRPLPMVARYVAHWPYACDRATLAGVMQEYRGTHDFRVFGTGQNHVSSVCTIDDIRVRFLRRYGVYQVVVRGDRFLYHMVRAMVGTAVACASGKWYTRSDIAAMCAAEKNAPAPYIAPAEGLALRSIVYLENCC